MKAETLKKAILQYAMQGKLVEQDPNDEPASILLERIKAEKEQLIKDGKIKKEKPLPPITEDEIPYELPKGWEWVRLSDVCNIIMGQSPNGNSVVTVGDGIEFHQGKVFFGNKYLNISNQVTTEPTKIAEPNSILLCVRAPVGKVNITDRNICIGRGLCSIKSFIEISTEFLYYLLLIYEDIFVKQATGTTFVAITGEIVKKQVIPLPPLAEQERIVERLEQILPLVEEYGKNEEKLSKLNSTLPDKIKQSILQHAVQGKLVPQNPDDEPASELLKRIKAEKEQLIKDGKIKKEKTLPPIIEDEIPYELPKGWEWVRLHNIINLTSGQDLPPNMYNSLQNGIPYITGASNIENEKVIINRWTDNGKAFAYLGNLLLTCKGTVGTMAILEQPKVHIARQIMAIDTLSNVDTIYVKIVLESYINSLKSSAKSIIPGISRDDVLAILFPLPPLDEQQRIVTKVEELLAIVDKLGV